MSCKNKNIFSYCCRTSVRKAHNALESCLRGDKVTYCGEKRIAAPQKKAKDWDGHEQQHNDFKIDHADHKPLRNPADVQADESCHKCGKNN